MAAGDYFNKANFKSMYTGSAWELTPEYNTENASTKYLWHKSFYFHATTFVIKMEAVQSAFAKITLHWKVYYYDRAQNTWVLYDDETCYQAWLDYDHNIRKIAHNRTETGIDRTDVSNNHEWFIDIEVVNDETSGNENNYNGYLNFYMGGTEFSNYNDSTCDFLWKPGEYIYGMAPGISENSTRYPSGAPDHRSTLRGTPISVSTGTARYIFSEG